MKRTSLPRAWAALGMALLALGSWSAAATAQTLSLESGTVLMGHRNEIPLKLNSAPAGVSSYEITVEVADGSVLDLEDVHFPAAFSERGQFRIAPDRNSIRISARDVENQVGAGGGTVILATLGVRGTSNGATRLQINVTRVLDDLGGVVNVAVENAQIQVKGGPRGDELFLVGGHGGALVNAVVAIPMIISQTPSGIAEYKLTVKLENLAHAVIEGVEFVAFDGAARVEISDDGKSVSFSAKDDQDVVRPQARGVVLARVVFRGELPGQTGLEVTLNRLLDDQGVPSGRGARDGSLAVLGKRNLPPAFFQEAPGRGQVIQLAQPQLAVQVEDNDLDDTRMTFRVNDSQTSYVFSRGDLGVSWDGRTLGFSLARAGVQLAPGPVEVVAVAWDDQLQAGRYEWRFCVGSCRTEASGSAASLERALDLDGNGRLGDAEILQAIQFWIAGDPVPNAGGRAIGDAKILQLIQLWIGGAPIA